MTPPMIGPVLSLLPVMAEPGTPTDGWSGDGGDGTGGDGAGDVGGGVEGAGMTSTDVVGGAGVAATVTPMKLPLVAVT